VIPSPLFHFTCECGHGALRREPVVRPAREVSTPAQLARLSTDLHAATLFAWFTDLTDPDPIALGVPRHGFCRLRFRWLVISAIPRPVPYLNVRTQLPHWTREALEDAPGVELRHWFVSRTAMPVAYSPVERHVRRAG